MEASLPRQYRHSSAENNVVKAWCGHIEQDETRVKFDSNGVTRSDSAEVNRGLVSISYLHSLYTTPLNS